MNRIVSAFRAMVSRPASFATSALTMLLMLIATDHANAEVKDQLTGINSAAAPEPSNEEARKHFASALKKAITGPERASALIGIGCIYAAEKNHTAARTEFEKALAIEGVTPEQIAQAFFHIAAGYIDEKKDQPAIAALEKALAQKGISPSAKLQSGILLGQTLLKYPGVFPRAREVFADVLTSLEITAEQKISAQTGMVKVLLGLKEYVEARGVMESLAKNERLPPAVRSTATVSIGKTLMLERNYPAARTQFAEALAMPEVSDPIKADIQLQIGLSHYDAQAYELAKPELMKVLDLPGAGVRPIWDGGRMGYIPHREASLRLQLRGLIPNEDGRKVLKVLFIGSSHTLRGDVPGIVTRLAASAPADRPRIIAGDFIRMGTTINTFWNAGDTPDTARGVIAAEPWDAVVFETFYTLNQNDLSKYGTLFADLIRSRNAQPILYESPITQASAYPNAYRLYHEKNVTLAKALKTPVAPSVRAWMRFLGPNPTAKQFGTVYADWIHATPQGAYMTACCIYSALTGLSPVGLDHHGIPDADAEILQQAAWTAYLESNPEVNR